MKDHISKCIIEYYTQENCIEKILYSNGFKKYLTKQIHKIL